MLIQYQNKAFINENASIPNTNKVTANDMNEIKTVVNTNYNELKKEIVTNTNGTAIKYPDGRMECFGKKTFKNMGFNTDFYGQFKRSDTQNLTADFPVKFAKVDTCVISALATSAWQVAGGTTEPTLSTTQGITMVSPNSFTNARDIIISFHAFGTWK